MFGRLIVSLPLMLCIVSPVLANGNCQAGLSKFAGGKVAFNIWLEPAGSNAVFVSGVTELNNTTVHDLHFSDRTDGISDRVQITIDASRSQLTTFNLNWKNRETVDLSCDPNSGAVTGVTGGGGRVRLALAKWSNPTFVIGPLEDKSDAIDSIPKRGASADDLARRALAVVQLITQSDPGWVSRMQSVENNSGLNSMEKADYRLQVIQLLLKP